MAFNAPATRRLHDEHVAATSLLDRFESLLRAQGRQHPPGGDGAFDRFLGDLSAALETEILPHFRFEEQELFPLLRHGGAEGMVELLCHEHEVLEPLMGAVVALAREARAGAFDERSWGEFHRLGHELIGGLRDHIEKEEMGMLPLAEEMLAAGVEAGMAHG